MSTNEIYKPNINEVIGALLCEQQWLTLLTGNGKPYNTLIPYLDKAIYQDPDESSPSIGELSKESGINTAKLKIWINEMYSDLWELNYERPELFNSCDGQRHELHFTGDSYARAEIFTLFLSVSLNLYEMFMWGFLKPKFEYSFHIKKILHVHEKGKIKTIVSLHAGAHNLYRDFLADKLYFLNRISVNTMQNPSVQDRDEILKGIRSKYD